MRRRNISSTKASSAKSMASIRPHGHRVPSGRGASRADSSRMSASAATNDRARCAFYPGIRSAKFPRSPARANSSGSQRPFCARQNQDTNACFIEESIHKVRGKTVESPVDGIGFVPGATPPHTITAHHTTCAHEKTFKKSGSMMPPSSAQRRAGKPCLPAVSACL